MPDWLVPVCTLIVVVVLPYVVNLLKKSSWSTNTKRWIAIVLSLAVGIATGLIAGLPTAETLVTWVLAVIGGTQVAYSAFKAIGVTSNWLDALEGVGVKDDTSKETSNS